MHVYYIKHPYDTIRYMHLYLYCSAVKVFSVFLFLQFPERVSRATEAQVLRVPRRTNLQRGARHAEYGDMNPHLQIQSNFDISNSDASNSGKLETFI